MKTFRKSFIKKKLLGKASAKAQSAMEYLMTYGWAILIVAVVLGALYSLGVFNGAAFLGTSCIAASGFYCTNPTLSTGGVLTVTIGQATGTTFKNAYLYFVPSGTNFSTSDPSTSIGTLNSGQQVTASIPLGVGSPYPAAYTLGTPLSGYLYLQFTDIYGTTEVNKIATVLTKVTASSSGAIASIPSGIVAYVPITLTNSQSSATPSPFQQMIQINEGNYANYIAYNGNIANFEFYTQSGQILPAWIESNNSGTLTVWVNLPNGIPASSSLTIYLGFASKTTNLLSSSGTSGIGEAPQLSSTYGQYDDIASVMQPGLIYQIYYYGSGACSSSGYQNNVYAATLGNGVTISSCASFVSSTNTFITNQIGSTQNVDGTNENNVIINYQESYSGGAAYPNPPVSNTADSWIIKTIGWADLPNQKVIFYGMGDDGIAAGYSTSGDTSNGAYWLGGTSNPNNIYNGWKDQGATTYSGTLSPGAYRVEQDYYENGGGAYTAFWTNATVNYYHAAYPPNGVMPSVSFGGLSTA